MVYTARQLHNDLRNLEAIADGYSQKLEWAAQNWLSYALQKDAIQNSWDARAGHSNWGVSFSLLSTEKGRFLVITDRGTTGMTGHIWSSTDEQLELIDSGDPKENLAFFLSSDFSAKKSNSGGKRGRGKSLFLVASNPKAFYFESLRNDGTKVYGSQYIASDRSVNFSVSQDRDFIDQEVGNRPSLNEVGTRIYIKDPLQSVVDALDNGVLINFIESTWWEIIKKYQANITVTGKYKTSEAGLLKWYDDEEVDKDESLSTKVYENIILDHEGRPRIKRIKFIYDPTGTIPENIKGLAIQRNGMTIERKNTESLVKEEGMQKVYGWVEFEAPLEDMMYDLEDVEHLKFNWTMNPARKVSNAIQAKAREFAKDVKIIESEQSKQHDKYKSIEEDAAKKINEYLKNLGFTGFSVSNKTSRPTPKPSNMPLSISMSGFELPGRTRRVEFNQSIKAKAAVFNNLNRPLDIAFRVWIVSDGDTLMMDEQEITLGHGESFELGWDNIKIESPKFKRGEYSFRSKVIIMEDTDIRWEKIGLLEKGNDRVRASVSFMVDQDPKASGFMKFIPKEEPNDKHSYLDAYRDDNTVVIEYNTVHPYVVQVTAQGEEKLRKFLLENGIVLALNEILSEDMSSDNPKIFKNIKADDFDPATILPTIISRVSEFLWTQ